MELVLVVMVVAGMVGTAVGADQQPCQQKDALLVVKGSLGSGPFFNNWTDATDCCQWNGVACNVDGMVTGITFITSDTSVGRIPDNLAEFRALENLHIGLILPNIDGPIPDGIKSLANLRTLMIRGTKLGGQVPPALGQIPNLRFLDLSNNRFTSGVDSLAGAAKLWILRLDHNHFSFNMSAAVLPTGLININLSHNQIYWTISQQVNDLKNLLGFSVSNNLLFGPIPSGLSKMPASAFDNNICLCGPPLEKCPPCFDSLKPFSRGDAPIIRPTSMFMKSSE